MSTQQEDLSVVISGSNEHTRQGVSLIVEQALTNAGFEGVSNMVVGEVPPWEDQSSDAPSLMEHIANRYPEFVRESVVILSGPETDDSPANDDDEDDDLTPPESDYGDDD